MVVLLGQWPNISQRTYPGIDPVPRDGLPDVDDCQFIAAIWCATGADPLSERPSLPAFRRAAGVPDRAGATAASVRDVDKALPVIFPGQPRQLLIVRQWSAIDLRLEAGDFVSISVESGALPPRLRFGFRLAHQVSVYRRKGRLWLANPLAPEGSDPLPISEAELRAAARALNADWFFAIAFQVVERWQVRVLPPSWGRYRFTRSGELLRDRVTTGGFTARCGPVARHRYAGKMRELVPILSGPHKGYWANRGALLVRVRSLNV